MTLIGYARVSTTEQHLDLQLAALQRIGCDKIFKDDGISAIARFRPGFENALSALQRGDTLVIWKMDRAFRSVLHSASALEEFRLHGFKLRCLTEQVDLDSASGRLNYHIRNASCAFERELISERTIAGLEAARKRGSVLGRPRKLSPKQVSFIRKHLQHEPNISYRQIAYHYGVSISTIKRALNSSKYS